MEKQVANSFSVFYFSCELQHFGSLKQHEKLPEKKKLRNITTINKVCARDKVEAEFFLLHKKKEQKKSSFASNRVLIIIFFPKVKRQDQY